MAGSKRYFEYVTDTGEKYSVVLDESNSEATIDGNQLMGNRTAAHIQIPKSLKLRYLLAESVGVRKLQRKFYVGDPIFLVGLSPTPIIVASPYPDSPAVDWIVTAYRGEKNSFIAPLSETAGDTGLNDGDQGRDQPV